MSKRTERRVRVCNRCGQPCCGEWENFDTCTPIPCDHTSERHTYDGCDGRWIIPSAPQGAGRE